MAYYVKYGQMRVSGRCATRTGAQRRARQFNRTVSNIGGRPRSKVVKA